MTERVKLINHNGKKIIHVTYSGLNNRNEKEFIDVIEHASQFILKQGKDLLILSDFTDSFGNDTIFDKLKKASLLIKPFRKKSAVVGISGIKMIFLKTLNIFSNSNLLAFSNIEDAKKWLVQ